MGLVSSLAWTCLVVSLLLVTVTCTQGQPKVFDVRNYGAVSDGQTDNRQAFLRAWNEACEWEGKARFLVPRGTTYMLNPIIFLGPCKGAMTFLLQGVLKAPTNPSFFVNFDHWITFRYIDWLTMTGGGTLDGQGAVAWPYNDCSKNSNCPTLPASVRFDFITNGNLKYIKSINSKNIHFNMFGCTNMNVTKVKIIAPANSPNTDGIKIGSSNNIRISHSTISTGDDCISIIYRSSGIDVSDVFCGPGHGISIGSLGNNNDNDHVADINVKNCTLSGTTAGLRIKTWASSLPGSAANITYEKIFMDNVANPIIIDQMYCPSGGCSKQSNSPIQIQDVKYINIWGTSSSKVAVSFQCSNSFPCKNVVTQDINLSNDGPEGAATSTCNDVYGNSYGQQKPPSCL